MLKVASELSHLEKYRFIMLVSQVILDIASKAKQKNRISLRCQWDLSPITLLLFGAAAAGNPSSHATSSAASAQGLFSNLHTASRALEYQGS